LPSSSAASTTRFRGSSHRCRRGPEPASHQLVKGLENEGSLVVPEPAPQKSQPQPVDYTAATAEAAVKAGDVSVALIVPHGFGEHPISFGGDSAGPAIQLLYDQSDRIAPQMVAGLLQKAAMTSMPATMAEQGMKYSEQYIGSYTPEQQKKMKATSKQLRQLESRPDAAGRSARLPRFRRRNHRRQISLRRGRKQEEPHDVLLGRGHRRHVSALHGQRFGRRAA
jgi:hypothetical protein